MSNFGWYHMGIINETLAMASVLLCASFPYLHHMTLERMSGLYRIYCVFIYGARVHMLFSNTRLF